MAQRFAEGRLKGSLAITAVFVIAVAVALLASLGGTAAATEPDTTPPAFLLSGSAIGAVEEEAPSGSYEIHIAATDGSESLPQSGIAKIEVSVDGSGQQSWEKYCPEGSCSLEESWTWIPGNYSGAYHVLTVKVTDHAGNTTEEEISPEGVEEVPGEHGYPTDTTPPRISFSGTAVEAAETGATSGGYELRMLARDGSAAEPQSGISKIEVAVDGTTLQSFEKYCPVGNCRLRVNWPYDPGNFSGTEHVITVTVRDHAGNVTTRTLELDRTPPTIELSGSLTEGLKNGTTEYPLHIHTTDGESEFPQSGVKSISISVDGEAVETVEQSCRFGSCPMDTEWTLNTATYGFEPHVIGVSVQDQAGNQGATTLPVPAPNGSIPACNGTGPVESPPDEVKTLSGGGKVAIYHDEEGEAIEFPVPPTEFNPKTATAEELNLYGFPPRPSASETEEREVWDETVGSVESFAEPGGCMGATETEFAPPPAPKSESESITEYQSKFAGWHVYEPLGSKTKWTGAFETFHQPELKSTCPIANSVLTSWVGLYGPGGALIQAGTNAPFSFENIKGFKPDKKHKVAAFTQTLSNERGKKLKSFEQVMFHNLLITPGDKIRAEVYWLSKEEKVGFWLEDVTEHRAIPMRAHKAKGPVYEGQAIDFTIERDGKHELQNFGSLEIMNASGFDSEAGEWRRLGSLKNRRRTVMSDESEGKPTGNVMASPSGVSGEGGKFSIEWKNCRP